MRILHILDHSPPCPGSYSRRVAAILRHQRLLGWKTMHMTGPGHAISALGMAESVSGDGPGPSRALQYFRTGSPAGLHDRLPLLGRVNLIARRLHQVAQLTRPQLLHVHSPVELAFAALRVGRRHGLPVVFEVHAPAPFSPDGSGWTRPAHGHANVALAERRRRPGSPLLAHATSGLARFGMRALEAWAAQKSAAVVTNSDGMCARLRAGGVAPGRISMVPDGLESAHYPLTLPFMNGWQHHHKPAPERERRGPAARIVSAATMERRGAGNSCGRSSVVLGFAPASKSGCAGGSASLAALKLVLAAMQALHVTGLNTQLVLACDTRQNASLLRLAEQQGMAAHVTTMSDQAGPECDMRHVRRPSLLAALHARVDIVLFPQGATNMATAPPRKLLEAMARGCIIAAVRSPEHEAIIEHGRDGVLFAPGDPAALADTLRVLVTGASRWPGMRTSARWFIDYHRSWETCVSLYKPIYERLLNKQGRP